MKIFGIDAYNNNFTNTFKAKKVSKPAEKFISEQPQKLLNAAMASIGMAGMALTSNKEIAENQEIKYKRIIDDIDLDLFMQVYKSDVSVKEKSKRLGISTKTYRKIVDELGLEFIPAKRGMKPLFDIPKERFGEVFNMDIPTSEKAKILGLSQDLFYHYASKMGFKKDKAVNISKEDFEKIFYMKIPLSEKYKMLNINYSWYYALAQKYGCITTTKHVKSITKEQFESINNQNIPQTEKCKKLGITRGTYIKLANKFGIDLDIKPVTYIRSADIPTDTFIKIYNEDITVAEKCEKLGISRQTYIKRAKELGLKPRKNFATNTDLSKITLEDFLKVYNDSSLTTNQKCLKLEIGEYSYFKLVRKWNLQRGKYKG